MRSVRIDRRQLLVGSGIAAAAWAAPAITSIDAVAAQSCTGLPPTLTMGANTSFIVPAVGANTSTLGDSTPAGSIPPAVPTTVVWYESGPTTLAAAVDVDATGPGTFTIPSTTGTATVAAGTTVFSYFVQSRRLVTGSAYFAGSLTVPAGYTVVGMAFRTTASPPPPDTLIATNALRRTDMTYRYNSFGGEGYETALYSSNPITPPAYVPPTILRDTVIIGAGGLVEWYAFTGGSFSDSFRLLIAEDC